MLLQFELKKPKTKKPKKINLQIKANVQLVRTCVLAKYLEQDRRKRRLLDRPATYLFDLAKRIEKEGLKQPIILAVSKITERAYVYEGNHRMTLKVNYFFLNDDHDKKFNFIPRLVNGN